MASKNADNPRRHFRTERAIGMWTDVRFTPRFHDGEGIWRNDPLVYVAGVFVPRRFRLVISGASRYERHHGDCIAVAVKGGTFERYGDARRDAREPCAEEHGRARMFSPLGYRVPFVSMALATVDTALRVGVDGRWRWTVDSWTIDPTPTSALIKVEEEIGRRLHPYKWPRTSPDWQRQFAENVTADMEAGRSMRQIMQEWEPYVGRTVFYEELSLARELGLVPYGEKSPQPAIPSWMCDEP